MTERRKKKRNRQALVIVILAVAIVCALGVRTYNGYWFFFDMPNRSGWTGDGPDRNYLDRHGGVITDTLLEIDSVTYYFDTDGSVYTGEIELDGYVYLFDESTGAMQTGWIEDEGLRYYYDELGHKIIDQEYTIDGNEFLFLDTGAEYVGAIERDGRQYYYEPLLGKLKNAEMHVDGAWYYYTEDGSRFDTGWLTVEEGRICYYDGDAGMLFGEQTIDGQQYLLNISMGGRLTGTVYFDGLIYTIAEDGVIQGKDRTSVWSGIDVSVHQQDIDWAAVKESGVQFAIIRAGYFAAEDLPVFELDRLFIYNVLEAQKQGISVGSYIYLYGFTEERITEGLESFNSMMIENRISLDLPVFLDIEDDMYFKPGSEELGGYAYRTNIVRYGMEYLKGMGYDAGFYTFQKWANDEFDAAQLFSEGYPFWLARWYNNNEDLDPATLSWNDEEQPSLWQYRATGQIPGIEGEVDKNYMYLDRMGG